MGREIRRVPPGWEHPTDEQGHYQPMHDYTHADRMAEWLKDKAEWENGYAIKVGHPDMPFEEWECREPDPKYYRPEWKDGEATAYQVYETVSEGTPMSPVFLNLDELTGWLVGQGYSRQAAEQFAKDG